MLRFWILFNVFAVGLLVLDLLVLHRRGRAMRSGEALAWSGGWVSLAAGFAVLMFFWQGRQVSLEFVTGYLLELSLSVDNLFLFLVIFRYFAVPEQLQRGVLFWGVLGALLMRGVFIVTGVRLISHFHWLLYLFGALLVYSGIRLGISGEHKVDPSRSGVVKFLRRLVPVTDEYRGGKFFVTGWKGNSGLYATPLLIALVVIETTDLLFAVDSIPAVLSVTLNAFIAYTSNVFAILGLRSLYFAVAGLMKVFRFLHFGLALVLIFVGVKMIIKDYFVISTPVTLSGIAGLLGVSIVASIMFPKQDAESPA
ncbi:MAG TPA: TerC family protein [Candidatus Binatia bacterium]|nr:TerC family protein [Candidatus Binatia bacterium]